MPSIKNESENENDSDSQDSRPDRDSSAEEASADSDDSSEMSEGECERRRSDCIENLSKFFEPLLSLGLLLYECLDSALQPNWKNSLLCYANNSTANAYIKSTNSSPKYGLAAPNSTWNRCNSSATT
jgi:hypothetical protein